MATATELKRERRQLRDAASMLDSIPDSKLPEQNWRSLTPTVELDHVLISKLPPWEVAIDFSTLEASDTILLQIHLRIMGPNPDQIRWVLGDEHIVSIHNEPDKTYLEVNGQPVSRGRLLLISPMQGPWLARLTYRQTLGFNKSVRLLLL